MKEKVLEIFADTLPQIDAKSSDSLIDDGILDSMSLIMLVSALSMEFGVSFDLDDLLPENFNSVDNIVETIKSLQ